jgi:hypothetical protein
MRTPHENLTENTPRNTFVPEPDPEVAAAERFIRKNREYRELKQQLGPRLTRLLGEVQEDVLLGAGASFRGELSRVRTPRAYANCLANIQEFCADLFKTDERVLDHFGNAEAWEVARTYLLDQLPAFLERWPGNPTRLGRAQPVA